MKADVSLKTIKMFLEMSFRETSLRYLFQVYCQLRLPNINHGRAKSRKLYFLKKYSKKYLDTLPSPRINSWEQITPPTFVSVQLFGAGGRLVLSLHLVHKAGMSYS